MIEPGKTYTAEEVARLAGSGYEFVNVTTITDNAPKYVEVGLP